MRLICEIEGCGAELSEGTGSHGGLMICSNCRSSSYYWKKKGLAAARARKESLELFTHRIEYYEPRVLQIMNNAKKKVAEARQKARDSLKSRDSQKAREGARA